MAVYMTEMGEKSGKGLEDEIHCFLGSYRPGPTSSQDTPHGVSFGHLPPPEKELELHGTFFSEATWAWDDFSPETSYSSFKDSHSSMMQVDDAPSEASQPTTITDNSSVHTPPPGEEALDKSVLQHVAGFDDFSHDNTLDIPHYDKNQALPRPLTLDIPHRVTKRSSPVRSRILKDVHKVNSVRDARACIKCRIQKVPCSASDRCDTCKKAYPQYPQTPEICCIRYGLTSVARDLSSRRFDALSRKDDHAVKETLRLAKPRFRETIFSGHIFFDRDISNQQGLPAALQNYVCMSDSDTITHSGCTFSRNPGYHNPAVSQHLLLQWAENLTSSTDQDPFEVAIDSFVKVCSKSAWLSTLRSQIKILLEKIHVFKSMYKIYRRRAFYFVQRDTNHIQQLPIPAQAELRAVARSALDSSERDVLAELDKFFKAPKLSNDERPVVWGALWQLMLIYRDLLRNMKPWRNNAEPLLNAVAVFYAACFRTTASLQLSLEGARQPELIETLTTALGLRDAFYQSIVGGPATIDQRLKNLVVDPEMKVLSRRPNRKSAAQNRGDDLVMAGC